MLSKSIVYQRGNAHTPTTTRLVDLPAQHAQSVNIVTVINVYATTLLVRVGLQGLVQHVPGPHRNASTARVHVPITTMRVDLLAQHAYQVNIVN
jgi:hypothetical protein